MATPKILSTWGGGEELFTYSGSVKTGTSIGYGNGFKSRARITASQYQDILEQFAGKEVPIGTSISNPPANSVGEWVKANVNKSGLMSYIGAILVHEGFATKPKRGWIRFV
jgi:hypothetical protein